MKLDRNGLIDGISYYIQDPILVGQWKDSFYQEQARIKKMNSTDLMALKVHGATKGWERMTQIELQGQLNSLKTAHLQRQANFHLYHAVSVDITAKVGPLVDNMVCSEALRGAGYLRSVSNFLKEYNGSKSGVEDIDKFLRSFLDWIHLNLNQAIIKELH